MDNRKMKEARPAERPEVGISEEQLRQQEAARARKEMFHAPKPKAVSDKIPFSVYAKIRGIDSGLHKAMMAFAKVAKASLIEWDAIFRKF